LRGRVSEDIVADVKRSADIVELISRYVALKKAGRSFKGLCPFHTEKTPSFIVNPERQFFHCFGCGKSGDVFTFVAEHERVDFPEAVRIVANAFGVSIPDGWPRRGGGGGGASKGLKTRLYELHTWATRFFRRCLTDGSNSAHARDYLVRRQFSPDVLDAWSIGYAPASWEALGGAARSAGFTDEELLASGLVIPREGGNGYYDRFRDRVVFPIRDPQGRSIAFGARALDDSNVKYLNSPETPLFSKSRCLYGLDKARDAVVEGRRILVTEGYTDTLMCHQEGVAWAVATLGTALTREHVGLLRRYAGVVYLLFDADQAGEAAVDRSLEVFGDSDLDVRVPALERGCDPCEFLVAQGAEPFIELIDAARPLFEVKLGLACGRHNMGSSDGRALAVDEALTSFAHITNVAKADLLTEAVAKRTGVDREAVRRRLAMLRQKPARRRSEQAVEAKAPNMDPVEHGILRAVLAASELVPCVLAQASLDDFGDSRVRRILERCIDLYDREGDIDLAELSATLQDRELAAIVADIAMSPHERANWEQWLQDCLDRLSERARRAELKELKQQVAEGPDGCDPDALAAILEHHRRRAGKPAGSAAD